MLRCWMRSCMSIWNMGMNIPLSAFSISEKSDVIDVYNWHQRIA